MKMLIWWGREGHAGVATGSGTADESKEAQFASALQKIVASPQEVGFSTGTRTVTITYEFVAARPLQDLAIGVLAVCVYQILLTVVCRTLSIETECGSVSNGHVLTTGGMYVGTRAECAGCTMTTTSGG